MTDSAKVFIKVNNKNCVIDIDSDKFIEDVTGWIQIDEGTTDRHIFPRGNYLSKPLFVQPSVCRYKYMDGVLSERIVEEIQADIAKIIAPVSEADLLKAQIQAMAERNEFLENCVAEIAMKVY